MQLHIEVNDKYVPDHGLYGSDEEEVEVEHKVGAHEGLTHHFKLPQGVKVMVTPNIDKDYWMMRVPVSRKQAIVCFEKFCTVGVGFQIEDDDWNVNLPWRCDAEMIYDHIKCNKGQKHITRAKCIEAIELLQAAIGAYLSKAEGTVEH